jgi:hypothetical protein
MSARCNCGHASGSHSWHRGRCLLCGRARCPAFEPSIVQATLDGFAETLTLPGGEA